MKVLVTGATGFLGQRIVSDLKNDHEVVAIGRNKEIGNSLGVDFRSVDLRDDLSGVTKEVDTVIHSAALSSPWGKKKDFYDINVKGTVSLIQDAIDNGVKKFIYISSTSIYFDFKDRFNIKETDSVAKKAPSLYTETKLKAENEILRYKDKIEISIIRPRGIFGPKDTTLIPRVINAHDKGRLKIIGSPLTTLDLTYVGNVSLGAILAMKTHHKSGEIFNITNDEPVKVWELIEKILNRCNRKLNKKVIPYKVVYGVSYLAEIICSLPFINKEPVFTRYTTGLLAKSQTLNIDKAKEVLGYKPLLNMNDAIDETLEWYLKDSSDS